MSCIFNVNDLDNSLRNLEEDLKERLPSISMNFVGLDNEVIKEEVLREISKISESHKINSTNVNEAILVFDNGIIDMYFDPEAQPNLEEIKTAMLAWTITPEILLENTSTDRLDNKEKNPQRLIEDPIAYAYGRALKARIRAELHVNTVGVHSLLYNEEGIINGVNELNHSIQLQQEALLQKVLEYLSGIIPDFKYSNSKMYENGVYTGIVEKILSEYGLYLKFEFNELNDLYNKNKLDILDSYSSWIILSNFDTVLKNTFGKAINIDGNKTKYNIGKYSIAGGSNVYTTWRTNEEINLSKEVNNVTLSIIKSLPYYTADSATPTNSNLKFNEFVYIISKIKELPLHAKQDFNLYTWNKEIFKSFSLETLDLIGERSLFQVINLLRDNPQKYLPAIIEVLNNKKVFTTLVSRIDSKYFASVDRDLINTIYQGLFSKENPNSLLSILRLKKGFQGVNYFAFITLTIDTMFKSNFLQYFRDPNGEIYVRNMYDLSLYNIELTIRQTINRFNSTLIATNYKSVVDKYRPEDDLDSFDILDTDVLGTYKLSLNGIDYELFVGNDQGTRSYTIKADGKIVTNPTILNELKKLIKSKFAKPTVVTYHIDNFHKGPLTIQMNLKNGVISYSINGEPLLSFEGKLDYDSLSKVIQDILQQNFDISPDYLEAYLNRISNNLEGFDRYGEATNKLMLLVTRVIVNLHVQENYIKNSEYKLKRIKELYDGDYQVSYNKKIGEIDFLGKSDTPVVKDLAEANALVTGRLTSSQILDGEGNALAASTLSRLVNSLGYLVESLCKSENSVVKHFILWNPGVYKGVSQLKELKDNKNGTSKNHVGFSSKEMENSLVFIDFLHGLVNEEVESTRTPLSNGIVGFYPSENSDKTFVGRLLIDLKAIKVGDTNLYKLIKENPSNIVKFYPIIRELLGNFYDSVLKNINSDWSRVQDLVDEYIIEYNNKILSGEIEGNTIIRKSPISYGNWNTITELANLEGITELEFVNRLIIKHNNENPNDIIVLRDQVHYVSTKDGRLQTNNSLVVNYNRFSSNESFNYFIQQQNILVLKSLLNDGVHPDSNEKIEKLIGSEWIDKKTNRVILGKYSDGTNIKHITDLDEKRKDIILNPLIEAYNSLNYFFTQEYMNSSVGGFYAHPNKKHKDISLLSYELKLAELLLDEKARKLALDKRNVDFTAAMHAFQRNLILGIPNEINVAIIPNSEDSYETIIGEKYDMDADDGACYSNPFYQILQNNSLGGARVGLIKKTFTHFYDEKTGTAGIFKDAEFPLTNEWIRRSTRYLKMMRNMTDRVWRNPDGSLAEVDILRDYNGNLIEFINPNCVRQGQLFYRDSKTGKYYAFWIRNGLTPNSYIKTVLEVDKNGIAIEEMEDLPEETIDTNYKLWNFLGGAYSMEIKLGQNELSYCESSIDMVVKIMNNTRSLNSGLSLPEKIESLDDVWLPLKHADIHLMPTVGAVKMGIANINGKSAYEEENPEKINFFRIRTSLMGVLLDKEHHADGEDLSIMTLVISACASRGYTPEQTLNLYNALASLARVGIKPYIKNFELFFKISSRSGATPEQLREARQNFENVLLDTLVKALANSTNDSATLQIVTQELLEAAKEGKHILFTNMKVPLSDPAVMRKLHSTISVALTRAAIKIKVDGSLNMLCPSNGIIKVYGGKMGNEFLNSLEIESELKKYDDNPEFELVNNTDRIKLGRTYKVIEKGENTPKLISVKFPEDYWKLRREAYKYESIREQFAPMVWTEMKKPTGLNPSEIQSRIDSISDIDEKIRVAKELGVTIEEREPITLEEIVSLNFPFKNLNSLSFREESGIKNFQAEGKLQFFNNKTGISIIRAAENIMEFVPVEMRNDDTLQQIRQIIIDFVTNYTPSQIRNYFKENLLNEGLSNYESEYNAELESYEDEKVTHFFEGGRELGAYNITFTGKINPINESSLIVTGSPSTTAKKAKKIGGIDTLRHPDANGMHFGNPFSHLEQEVRKGNAKVLMPNVREAVIAFELWLNGTAYYDIEPERRKWIVDLINSGVLAGRTLVYYTNTIKDSEGTHYYNPETFPNHAQILLKYINQKAKELAGPLFSQESSIEKGFNLYDLKSVKELHDLKERKRKGENISKEEIDEAMLSLLSDLNVLHSKYGQVETIDGIVTINSNSINIEPYEIVLPKIFATVFGLKEGDNLNQVKSDPDFFMKRLIENLNTIPSIKTSEEGESNLTYTLALLKINGKHTYILDSNNAVRSNNFRPKEILKIRENGKLYRKSGLDLLYELNEGDQVWEYIDLNGNATEVIITDNVTSYIDRVDFTTININTNNSTEYKKQLIDKLRNSDNKSVLNYIEMVDYLIETREQETLEYAIEDIQDISVANYSDHPLGNHFRKLGNQIYASFLKSLEVVAARIPAQSMQSFMPMRVVGFEESDINTAYVSTTQMLFLGSDYDIDAVSIAAYSFDGSGRYIIHSPLANIESISLLKASQNIPFPTGELMEINEDEVIDYNSIVRLQNENTLKQLLLNGTISQQDYNREMAKPFYMVSGGNIRIYNNSPEAINNLSKFIKYCNSKGYIPGSSAESFSIGLKYIKGYINRHNNYINTSKDVEAFSKNFIVTSMFDIGLSPANLIESQAALDSITGPLKEAANATLKAMLEDSFENPANFTTNVHGLVLNMDGKLGVGICAVGLKGYFAATARYNEVLNNGTPEEVERLRSDVEIAKKRFKMLANAYTTNEVNLAILGEIITQLDQTNDAALTLSALLSLATDNAKELALSKLNAANMLGMYIYGIAIGMDFKNISKIIASNTGIVIDSLMKEDSIVGEKGMSMENIFDYIELGPRLENSRRISEVVRNKYRTILDRAILRELAWNGNIKIGNTDYHFLTIDGSKRIYDLKGMLDLLEGYKINPPVSSDEMYEGIIEYNRNIEKALRYIEHIVKITTDGTTVNVNGVETLIQYNGNKEESIYGNIKKLYAGGEEMRTLGKMLHINLGNETSYVPAISYIDTIESAMSQRQYAIFREKCRISELNGEKRPTDYSGNYEFNFHNFIFNQSYRDGVIDLYGGLCNKEKFMNDEDYRTIFEQIYPNIEGSLEEKYNTISQWIKITPSKVFLNVLDIIQVPHYMEYIKSADMLFLYMSNSIKYRGIYKLGKRGIHEIGAYSQNDREKIFRRTELFIDTIIRDRFFFSLGLQFQVPENVPYFIVENGKVVRVEPVPGKTPPKRQLGTIEGNASFKLLVEDVIIPELLKMERFKDNKFILSLKPTLFSDNPELLTTICRAPNINMSPRSETDSALFEEIKHDFNELRTETYKYQLGNLSLDLIDLFYYYNLIAFGGKVGENTLTNIFLDVLDYRNVKNYRDFESQMDKEGNLEISDKENGIEGTISLDTLIRRIAIRANSFSTNLNYFYEENSDTGLLEFKERNENRYTEDPDTGMSIKGEKYTGTSADYITEEGQKNYVLYSIDTDRMGINYTAKDGRKVNMVLEKGVITEINVDGIPITISLEDKQFFRNLKMIPRITAKGVKLDYDKNSILSKVDEIISCKL